MIENEISKAYELIQESEKITVLSGAGISAESGVPIFRGDGGLWNNYRPEELATPKAFFENPEIVWQWYDWRRSLMKKAEPNAGHYALTELQRQKEKFTLITQNVDGLHQKAGTQDLIEMHGNLWEIRCTKCGHIEKNYEVPLKELPPMCDKCGELMRPNIVWFNEIIPMQVIDKCLLAIEDSDLFLIIGTSGIVEPAASFGILAKQNEKPVIELNLEQSPNTGLYDISIRAKSGEVLPLLVKTETTYN
ncbi:MAG: NAD-dependent protein deacylase [Candidatus Dadabacteria bacterium]|nr:NAD-dependent protein deacylase [Candidatus Dadabacteria bacterium]NIQ16187.1 NAD-dependent protein deacylase [Candidatus Dadabacteria bacterium]